MTKLLREEIRHRSKLRNQFLKKKTQQFKDANDKQINFCVSLLRKTKRSYFANLNIKIIKGNRQFWKKVNPLFSEKSFSKKSASTLQTDSIITDSVDLAET